MLPDDRLPKLTLHTTKVVEFLIQPLLRSCSTDIVQNIGKAILPYDFPHIQKAACVLQAAFLVVSAFPF